jgi:hypothetical protein
LLVIFVICVWLSARPARFQKLKPFKDAMSVHDHAESSILHNFLEQSILNGTHDEESS